MLTTLQRGLFASLLLAIAVCLISFNAGGASLTPDWVGKWKEVDKAVYWDLSADELQVLIAPEAHKTIDDCYTFSLQMVDREGNRVTYVDGKKDTTQFEYEVSGDTLTATDLDSGEIKTAQSAEEIPFDADECKQSK